MNDTTNTPADLTTLRTFGTDDGESRSIGIGHDPTAYKPFVALTLASSASFKTHKGAVAWLARRGYKPNGETIRPASEL